MQPKITRLEYLKQTIEALTDDPTKPWNEYPCLIWPFRQKGTYPLIKVTWGRRFDLVSRAAFIVSRGAIPRGHNVCHRCDTPACFRPSHLFSGTQRQNIHDAIKKNRIPRGDQRYNAKMTVDTVMEMRRLHAKGMGLGELAERFSLCKPTVCVIVNRKTWKHVP